MSKQWKVIANSGLRAVFQYRGDLVEVDLPEDRFLGRLFLDCWPGQSVKQEILEELLGKKVDSKAVRKGGLVSSNWQIK